MSDLVLHDWHSEVVTIASGGTVSSAFDFRIYRTMALELPAAFTGTAITFQAARNKEATYTAVYDDAGAAVTTVVAQGRVVSIDAAMSKVAALGWMKLVSGSAEGGDRSIRVWMKG